MEKIKHYVIMRKIGQGGMSDVYLVRDTNDGYHYALKLLRANHPNMKRLIARFRKEAEIIFQLNHSNVIKVYEHGKWEKTYYLIMEYIAGSNLKQRIQQNGGLEPKIALNYLKQIAAALSCAHTQDIIHRDIKPANILLTGDDYAVLTDFGIAKDLDSKSEFTKSGTAIGTPQYMSPEQITAQKRLTCSTDIYSLGVLFFEMLTGKTPYHGLAAIPVAKKHVEDPVPFLPNQFKEYQYILDSMMAKKSAERIQDAKDLLVWLEEHQNDSAATNGLVATDAGDTLHENDVALHITHENTRHYSPRPTSRPNYHNHADYTQHTNDDSQEDYTSTWQALKSKLSHSLEVIRNNNILLVVLVAIVFLTAVIIAIKLSDQPIKPQITLKATSKLPTVLRFIGQAEQLVADNAIFPPKQPNALNVLKQASANDPTNISIRADIAALLSYGIKRDMFQGKLNSPPHNSAWEKSEQLMEYTSLTQWKPIRITLLTQIIDKLQKPVSTNQSTTRTTTRLCCTVA